MLWIMDGQFVRFIQIWNVSTERRRINDEKDDPEGDYWCAHGVAYPQRNGTVKLESIDNSTHSVRCVYDDWYWGSDPVITSANRSPFTWGDQPR